jgi:hypothetical protein
LLYAPSLISSNAGGGVDEHEGAEPSDNTHLSIETKERERERKERKMECEMRK